MSIRVVETQGPTYEIDIVNRKIRTDDNVWKPYQAFHGVLGGYLIEWAPGQRTLTPPIVNEYERSLS